MSERGQLLSQYMTEQQQEILALAIALIHSSPDQTGVIVIEVDHGKPRFAQVTPSLRFNPHEKARDWLRRAATPFE